MKKIIFATNNAHKLEEVREILKDKYEVVSLAEIGFNEDIPETADTLEGNALIKAEFINKKYGFSCFADDTGLEVEALNGAPGVFSARYAGEQHDSVANMQKLLTEMHTILDRKARFRTVVTLIENGEVYYFEGEIKGQITTEPRGKTGFGYDPIFMPDGYDKTFAELGSVEKNTISHRALAVKKLAKHLNYN